MSRVNIFTSLFLTLILGTVGSIFLYQQWFNNYKETVVKSDVIRDHKAANAALHLFAYEKLQAATSQVMKASALLSAFGKSDAKKRHDAAFDALNALKGKGHLKSAAFAAATDGKGKAFANNAKVGWKADWSKHPTIAKALKGEAAHGFVMHAKKAHLIIAVPVSGTAPPAGKAPANDDGGTDKPDDRKAAPKRRAPARRAPVKRRCKAGKYWYCFPKCLKRAPKKKGQRFGKCLKRSKTEKTCYCRKGKKSSSLSLPKTHRMAQKAPDARAKGDDASEPSDAGGDKDKLDAGKNSVIGVVAVGFALDKALAAAVKKHAGVDVTFFTTGGTLGSTLGSDELARVGRALANGKSPKTGEVKARNAKPFSLSLGEGKTYFALSARLPGAKEASVLLLQPNSDSLKAFMQYNLMVAGVGGVAFILALLFLLMGAGKFRRAVQDVEDKVLETYSSGDLQVAFNEKAPGPVGSLAASLNKLYAQLLEQPTAAAAAPASSGGGAGWDAPYGGDAPAASEPAPVRYTTPEPPPQEPQPTQQANLQDEPEEDDEQSTADMINHFLANPDAHYLDVYTKYRDAKEECGEDTSRLKQDKFIEKLRKNAASYASKYDCKGVLFDVTIKDNKVILKPQLIPKE